MCRGWLIDTNIVSEWVRPRADAGVVRWLDEVDEDRDSRDGLPATR
jgi:predicted nucleic acid-binding protein